jgi:hypothetical protein
MVLVGLGVKGADLTLSEGVIQGGIDLIRANIHP